MESLLLRDVSFAYDDEPKKKHHKSACNENDAVLKKLNLAVHEGEFVCLVGHSGCGKTSTLKILAGLLEPCEGSVSVSGKPLTGPGPDRAVVFQNYALFPWMSALQNVEFGIKQASEAFNRAYSKEQIRAIALEYLEILGMARAAKCKPYQLSGGMQQRVAIARALAMNTPILLFDEPFGALDVKTRRELQALMQELWLREGAHKTAVFVTHDIDEALLLADRIVFMSDGRFLDEFALNTARPRDPESFSHSEAAKPIKQALMKLFFDSVENQREEQEPCCQGGL